MNEIPTADEIGELLVKETQEHALGWTTNLPDSLWWVCRRNCRFIVHRNDPKVELIWDFHGKQRRMRILDAKQSLPLVGLLQEKYPLPSFPEPSTKDALIEADQCLRSRP